MTFRKLSTVDRPGFSVVVGYCAYPREYRCRLVENGKANEPADYFTDDKADALATAKLMADRAYVNKRDTLSAAITTEELKRLVGIANEVWQYIGSDFMADSNEIDNEAAVECCFDADRPLLSRGGCTTAKEVQADHAFCKAMYAKHGFDTVTVAVANAIQLV